jgi:hypothetical protein
MKFGIYVVFRRKNIMKNTAAKNTPERLFSPQLLSKAFFRVAVSTIGKSVKF